MLKNDISLGSGQVHQKSINPNIDISSLKKIFFENKSKIDEYLLLANDKYANELFDYLYQNKEFNFPINKHIELYITK